MREIKDLKAWDKEAILMDALNKVIDIFSMEYEISCCQVAGVLDRIKQKILNDDIAINED